MYTALKHVYMEYVHECLWVGLGICPPPLTLRFLGRKSKLKKGRKYTKYTRNY
jgi:hypothetical protein